MTRPRLDLVFVGVALGTKVHVATCGAVHRGHLTIFLVTHDGGGGHVTHSVAFVTLEFTDLVHGLVALVAQMHFTFRTMDTGCLAAAIRLLRLALDAATQMD